MVVPIWQEAFDKVIWKLQTLESVALPVEPAVLCELLCIHPADKEERVRSPLEALQWARSEGLTHHFGPLS